jgi:hypothetical protein
MGARDTPQLARGAGGHLVTTWRTDAEGQRWANLAYVPFGAAAPEVLGDAGCGWGWTPLVAVPGGFLLAARSSLGDGPDACGKSAVLSIVHIDEASRAVTRSPFPASTALDDPAWCYTKLLLAARAGGAWLLAQPIDHHCENDDYGQVLVLRLHADGTPEGGWKEVPLAEEDSLWGTTVLGDRLIVISRGREVESKSMPLRFTMVEEDGRTHRVYEMDPAYSGTTPVPSPDGTRLLMATTEGLLRLSCAAEER